MATSLTLYPMSTSSCHLWLCVRLLWSVLWCTHSSTPVYVWGNGVCMFSFVSVHSVYASVPEWGWWGWAPGRHSTNCRHQIGLPSSSELHMWINECRNSVRTPLLTGPANYVQFYQRCHIDVVLQLHQSLSWCPAVAIYSSRITNWSHVLVNHLSLDC